MTETSNGAEQQNGEPRNTGQTAGPSGPLPSDHEPGRTAGDSPAANQRAAEPMPPTPAHGEDRGQARDDQAPPDAPDAGDSSSVPVPGNLEDAGGNVTPHVFAAKGTSEETPAAEGVRPTAIAQPGKPDGEPAT